MQKRLTAFVLGVMVVWAPRSTVAQQCCSGEQCPGDLNCDNAVEVNELVTAVNSALNGCPALSSPTATPTVTSGGGQRFPATGQTTCWDTSGNVIACSGTGQDGEIRAGGALAYVDNGDGTITDLNTHLMWEKKSADGGIHDQGNFYSWADGFGTFIAGLNTGGGFAGHTDWRLPNVKELQSIINYQNTSPAVSAAFNTNCESGCSVTTCSCTQAEFYWSATTDSGNPSGAWYVYFFGGMVFNDGKTRRYYVRAVRGGS